MKLCHFDIGLNSGGPNAVPLKHMRALLETLFNLDLVTQKSGFFENDFN